MKAIDKILILASNYRLKITERYFRQQSTYSEYTPWLTLGGAVSQRCIDKRQISVHKKIIVCPDLLSWIKNELISSSNGDLLNSRHLQNIYTEIHKFDHVVDIYGAGLRRLEIASGFFSKLLNDVIFCVVPLDERRPIGTGVSYQSTKGAIFLGIPSGPFPDLVLAINIAHEIGHQVLMLYQSCDYLIEEKDLSTLCYSGVRKTFRPAINCLHAAVSLSYMIRAASELRVATSNELEENFLMEKINEYKSDLVPAMESLIRSCSFTGLGKFLVKDILENIEGDSHISLAYENVNVP